MVWISVRAHGRKRWKGTHRACLFQSEEGVSRTRLKDTFDQGEWQPFNTVDCYGWRLSKQHLALSGDKITIYMVYSDYRGTQRRYLSLAEMGCRSPRWQYQASERSPLPAPLSINMVDGRENRVRRGNWKILTVFVSCGTGTQCTVAPAGGLGGCRPMGSRPRTAALHEKYLTVTCFRDAFKLLDGYETGINKRECTQEKGQGRGDKLQRYRRSCSIRNRRCSVTLSVSSTRTEESEQRVVDPLFEETACSAALRRSFMILNSSSSF